MRQTRHRTRVGALGAQRARGPVRRFLTRLALVLLPVVLVSGCMEGNRLAFAPAGEIQSRPGIGRGKALTAVFGEGTLVLAAPSGFCFDAQMEEHTTTGGFAMLARCDRLSAFGGFRTSEGAMLTATVGTVAENTPTPTAEALRSAFTASRTAARVLETRGDRDIPLVKLYLSDHSALGASGTHWRGAFVIRGHLVSVALYAPEGSSYLGEKGARLIQEFMRATRNATQLAEATTPADPGDAAPVETTRPRARVWQIGRAGRVGAAADAATSAAADATSG
ncbi:hypothetical protein [Tritonibacter horizontis]|uniref:hypothetical protein n=1 Tax=Tritonibacter horizontis TaxID=1768241 RepID=UPI00082F02B5|nr:hypothetical protein [Tritonibacter horizontis]